MSCSSGDKSSYDMELKPEAGGSVHLPLMEMDSDSLYDRILGMLVGGAIGDAMGAPTEMWSRNSIRVEYGFVDSLDDMVRVPSPEGTWRFNLPAGGSTDDTRWKVLLSDFIQQQGSNLYQQSGPDPYAFADFIVQRYEREIAKLKTTESFDPEPFEYRAMRMAWLQEWALVAQPFRQKDIEAYTYALHRFYGGENTCAGMLFSPMIGLAFPSEAEGAYKAAYRLSIFDQGFARDITALTASMLAESMNPQRTPESVMAVLRTVDPQKYFHSRLVGRSSYRIYRQALYLVDEAKGFQPDEEYLDKLSIPTAGRDTLQMARLQKAFELLDNYNQDMPFHAGEIHLINLAALLFGNFEFQPCLEFVINYGRDNDTVAAITGSILGAYHGFSKLPKGMTETVLRTHREQLGIDLEQVARDLTANMIQLRVVNETS